MQKTLKKNFYVVFCKMHGKVKYLNVKSKDIFSKKYLMQKIVSRIVVSREKCLWLRGASRGSAFG